MAASDLWFSYTRAIIFWEFSTQSVAQSFKMRRSKPWSTGIEDPSPWNWDRQKRASIGLKRRIRVCASLERWNESAVSRLTRRYYPRRDSILLPYSSRRKLVTLTGGEEKFVGCSTRLEQCRLTRMEGDFPLACLDSRQFVQHHSSWLFGETVADQSFL